MTSRLLARVLFAALIATTVRAQEPPWDPARVKACDRACVGPGRRADGAEHRGPAGTGRHPPGRAAAAHPGDRATARSQHRATGIRAAATASADAASATRTGIRPWRTRRP